jgi:hypothetical protein
MISICLASLANPDMWKDCRIRLMEVANNLSIKVELDDLLQTRGTIKPQMVVTSVN